jgi:hypothetical protein
MEVPPKVLPSPLAGEGLQRELLQKRGSGEGLTRLRANDSLRRRRGATPHPAFGHLLPQGEKEDTCISRWAISGIRFITAHQLLSDINFV